MNKTKITIVGGLIVIGGIIVSIILPDQPAPAEQAPISGITLKAAEELIARADYNCQKNSADDDRVKQDINKLSGKIIYYCNFSSQTPDTKVFPDDLNGTIFVCAHLDNVIVPQGNVIANEIEGTGCGSRLYYKAQNDGEDWIIDEKTKEPIEPLNKQEFERDGLSTNPKDIPSRPLSQPITETR